MKIRKFSHLVLTIDWTEVYEIGQRHESKSLLHYKIVSYRGWAMCFEGQTSNLHDF